MKKLKLFPAVIALALLAGCASPGLNKQQKRAVSSYAQSAQALNGMAGQEFLAIRNQVIELNKLTAAFSPTWDAEDKDFDRALNVVDTRTRVKAVATLRSYAELLSGFVDDWEDDRIKGAAANFVSNVRDLDSNQKIDDNYLNVFEKVVTGIGRIFVEKKKKEAVVAVVAMSHEQVAHLCDLLIKDFSGVGGYTSQLVTTASQTLVAADSYLRKSGEQPGRDSAVEAYDLGQLALQRHAELHAGISEAAEHMKQANTDLVDVLREKKPQPFKSFAHFKLTVEALAETAQYYTR